ncbi:hypothetical protein F1C10_14215 [Sphingomonas sp. NBWT7]|uniref:hypothetical protein n=1 Tax=Sphingomonas sp. NBWT7 TaxID=2596913 RepID=UPI001626A0EA|nr:hypothetical protein [Sphingomonas sp. NBWT7]QNE32961.1 hypothetical protein F1C10_14215 [Sphingomonas sp. NBWT7]
MLTVSCDIAPNLAGERFEDIAERAVRALYEAKNGGRNTFRAAWVSTKATRRSSRKVATDGRSAGLIAAKATTARLIAIASDRC